MKNFIDFIPLVLFFIVFKMSPVVVQISGISFTLGGAFSATAVLIVSSLLVYGMLLLYQKHLEKGQWLTLAGVLIFGSLTIAFHNITYLKWKAPIINWLFALGFLLSQYIGDKPVIQRLMERAVELPRSIWIRLNIAWVIFFIFLGLANLVVAFTWDKIWVDFKVFGSLILTILFVIIQSIYISRHIKPEDKNQN